MSLHDIPSESDRQEDLARQYANLTEDGVIFCPWCSKGNKPGMGTCCGFFAEGVAKIGQEKFQSVVAQLREVRLGGRRSIACPYCGAYNRYEENPADWTRPMVSPFCCSMMYDAALAISQRIETARLVDQKKKIEDGLQKVGMN